MDAVGRRTMRKVWWRTTPLISLVLLFNLLDRANISYAALQMNKALGFSNAMFGLSAGFLAIGILIAAIPSTLMLHRFGARRWIAICLLAWGACSAATAFVKTAEQLMFVRFLLGMAEAGFIPGAIHYFSHWFPEARRSRILSSFVLMQPVGLVVGGPVSGILLSWNGLAGMAGWQWLFLIEAAPTLILAILVMATLADRPAGADWLDAMELQWLESQLATSARQPAGSASSAQLASLLVHHRIWLLALSYFAIGTAATGAIYFIPLMIRSMHYSLLATGVLSAAPPLAAALCLPLWGRWADRSRYRQTICAFAAVLMSISLGAASILPPTFWMIPCLSLATVGFFGFLPAFYPLPSNFLAGAMAAAGIAAISVVGNIANLAGPYLFGWLADRTASFTQGLQWLAAVALLAAVLMTVDRALDSKSPSGGGRMDLPTSDA